MNPNRRLISAAIATIGVVAFVGPVFAKQKNHSGEELLGKQKKAKGDHVIQRSGPHTVTVNVAADGRITGMKVKHDKKGELPVKKYKTTKKMATTDGFHYASYPGMLAQAQSLGTVFIGYAYIDDYGDEQIYWWPFEMIYDGDTGAVEYIPYA